MSVEAQALVRPNPPSPEDPPVPIDFDNQPLQNMRWVNTRHAQMPILMLTLMIYLFHLPHLGYRAVPSAV